MQERITRDVVDGLIDAAAFLRGTAPAAAARCADEDATVALLLEGVDELIRDIAAGEVTDAEVLVTATPRLDRLRDIGLQYAETDEQDAIIVEAHAGVTSNMQEAAELVTRGLVAIEDAYAAGDCLRDSVFSAATAAKLDQLEVLAERRSVALGLKRTVPYIVAGAAIVGLGLYLAKKR